MKHSTTYTLCIKLINAGKTEGLADKVDIYFANNRISEEEYEEIMSYLVPKAGETSKEPIEEDGENE